MISISPSLGHGSLVFDPRAQNAGHAPLSIGIFARISYLPCLNARLCSDVRELDVYSNDSFSAGRSRRAVIISCPLLHAALSSWYHCCSLLRTYPCSNPQFVGSGRPLGQLSKPSDQTSFQSSGDGGEGGGVGPTGAGAGTGSKVPE